MSCCSSALAAALAAALRICSDATDAADMCNTETGAAVADGAVFTRVQKGGNADFDCMACRTMKSRTTPRFSKLSFFAHGSGTTS